MVERVSFPDATDYPGLPMDPFGITAKTEEGDQVRPAVVVALLNRNMKRTLERRIRRQAHSRGLPSPVVAPLRQQLSERDTTDRVADMLLGEYDRYHRAFPAHTLAQFLDRRTAETMVEAFRQGKPIDREATRRAIGALWQESQSKRKEKNHAG